MQVYVKNSSLYNKYKNPLDDYVSNNGKRYKPTYEIKKENGYLRHYVTKANGERVMIKETKLPKAEEQAQTTGEVKDQVNEMVLAQLTKPIHRDVFERFEKTGIFAQKEKQLTAYKTGI